MAIECWVFYNEQEIKIVGLDLMLIVPLCDNSHNFTNAFDFLNQCNFTLEVHHTAHGDWMQEQNLVNSQQSKTLPWKFDLTKNTPLDVDS